MKRTNRLTEGNILHTLIRFAVPVFFTLFLQALYGGVDLLVVGQFAATADVSGVATGSMLMSTVTMVITGLSMGITILVGERIGRGEPDEAGRAIGGGILSGDNDDALSVKAIETAVEQGITWIDTAPIYGLYHSEEVVGEALRHIDRDKVILSTKCGLEWRHESPVLHKVVDGVQTYRDLSARSIIEDVEDSLRRLGTDHLDVLYTHWQTPDLSIFPLEETVEAMMKLKEQGKIRAIGASNTTAEFIRGYCKYGQLDVIQEKYSLLTRRIEKQLLPTCKELGVSIQAYSPLEQGLLTGKVTMDTTYPEGSTRNTNPCFQPARRMQAIRLLDSWSDLCEKYHCTKAQLVIALTARMIPGLHVLCGARTPEQAIDNAGALHIALEGADAVQMKWDVDAIS